MNDSTRPGAVPPESEAGIPLSPLIPIRWRGRVAGALVALTLLSMAFGAWGLWRLLSPESGDIHARLAASEKARAGLQVAVEDFEQRVATLTRSDQISRDANRDLQNALSERDEEIAGLRADVAFYERLVGATGQRRGLSVHAIRMRAQNDTAWHFTSTLTQNLNRGAVSSGQLTLAVEGSRDGRREILDWDALRQGEGVPGLEYSFKYFQQIEGDLFLPEGFEPVRVTARLQSRSGATVEQSFTWADATREAAGNTGAEAADRSDKG